MIEKIVTAVFRTIEIGTQTIAKVRGTSANDSTAGVREPPRLSDPFAHVPDKQQVPPKPIGNPEIPVQVFGRMAEPWTGRVLLLLKDRDVPHEFVDTEQSEEKTLAARLLAETRQE